MKKKRKINPLSLDKETIARLDEKQMEALAGGVNAPEENDEATCLFLTKKEDGGNDGHLGCCGSRAL